MKLGAKPSYGGQQESRAHRCHLLIDAIRLHERLGRAVVCRAGPISELVSGHAYETSPKSQVQPSVGRNDRRRLSVRDATPSLADAQSRFGCHSGTRTAPTAFPKHGLGEARDEVAECLFLPPNRYRHPMRGRDCIAIAIDNSIDNVIAQICPRSHLNPTIVPVVPRLALPNEGVVPAVVLSYFRETGLPRRAFLVGAIPSKRMVSMHRQRATVVSAAVSRTVWGMRGRSNRQEHRYPETEKAVCLWSVAADSSGWRFHISLPSFAALIVFAQPCRRCNASSTGAATRGCSSRNGRSSPPQGPRGSLD